MIRLREPEFARFPRTSNALTRESRVYDARYVTRTGLDDGPDVPSRARPGHSAPVSDIAPDGPSVGPAPGPSPPPYDPPTLEVGESVAYGAGLAGSEAGGHESRARELGRLTLPVVLDLGEQVERPRYRSGL